jgi:beta-lactamase regulating signal transducer with metallopeptidase domain
MTGELMLGKAAVLTLWVTGFLAKAAVLLAVVLTIIWFRRRASAAARHQALALLAASVLLLPLVSLLVPQWCLGWFSMATTASMATGAGEPTATAGETSWLPVTLAAVWLAGSAVLLILLVAGRLRGLAAVRAARPLQEERLGSLIDAISDKVGLGQKVDVKISDQVKVPVVFGWWSPRLILPESLIGAAPVSLEAILMHELAHIKRHDVLTQSLAQLMCCLHWPNPLAWVVERRLMIERERACDDIVLLSGGRASDYARLLMDTAGALKSTRNPVWAMAAMAEGTDFKDRVLSILDPNALRTKPPVVSALVSTGLILFVAGLVAAAQPFAVRDVGEIPLAVYSEATRDALQELDPESDAVNDNDRRQPVIEREDTPALPDDSVVDAEERQAAAVGALFDAIGEIAAASAGDDQEAKAEAEVVQEMMSSLGGMVREGDDEQAARDELARFFRSLGKLMLIEPSDVTDQSQSENPATGEEHKEGNSE